MNPVYVKKPVRCPELRRMDARRQMTEELILRIDSMTYDPLGMKRR